MLKRLFCVSGRLLGDDDDTVGVIAAINAADAERHYEFISAPASRLAEVAA